MARLRPGFAAALLLSLPPALPAQEFRDLFNGKDLDGWVIEGARQLKDGTPIWTVADGHIKADAGKNGYGFLRYEKQPFGDFVFRVEYRFAPATADRPKGNSGLGIRTPPYDPKKSGETRPSYAAYEIQLLDDAGQPANAHGSGSLYRYLAPTANAVKPAPEWNTVEVTCRGPRIKVAINGQTVVDADQTTLADLPPKGRPATIPAPKDKPLKGFLCLQSHTGQVEFRKVQVADLPPPTDR
jgi:hypothetical protein